MRIKNRYFMNTIKHQERKQKYLIVSQCKDTFIN